jgi:hypothetical protein
MDQSFWAKRMGRGRRSRTARVLSLGASFGLLGSLGSLGCGGRTGDSGGTCESVVGCGGDITGNWDVTAICNRIPDSTTMMTPLSPCDAVAQRGLVATSFSSSDATFQFTGDTFVQGGTTNIDTTLVFSDACLATKGLGSASSDTCTFLEGTLRFRSVACSPDSGTCRCTVSDTDANESGSYGVTGSQIFLNGSKSGRYCVKGDRAIFSIGSNQAPGIEARYSLRRRLVQSP